MKPTLTILTALLLAPPVLLNAADTPNPTRKPNFVSISPQESMWSVA